MTDGCKKFLCELAGCSGMENKSTDLQWLAILIKAVFAINREGLKRAHILMNKFSICVDLYKKYTVIDTKYFEFDEYNSEQDTLQAALEYIYREERKKQQ